MRSNKLYSLYKNYNAIEDIDEKTKEQIQNRYFKKSFDEIYDLVKNELPTSIIEESESNPKVKMKLIFEWYINNSLEWVKTGEEDYQTDYQVLVSSALGAFNQWVKATSLENWQNRHVTEIAKMLMKETAHCVNDMIEKYSN